jgi:molybdopterin-guanine dinucleotide biosynthesis protein A
VSSDRIAAAIVAGGASTRFGGIPKGLEKVGGRRILDRVVEAARTAASDVFLVSNADDAASWVTDIRVVKDVRQERGSLIGIHTALETTRMPTLVLAWDMPFVTPSLLSLIVSRGRKESFAAIPESASGPEPFCALYTPACLPIIETAIDDGDLRVTKLPSRFPSFALIPLTEIERLGDPTRLFFNVNSIADLARAEELERSAGRSPSG